MLMILGSFLFEENSLLPNQRSRQREQKISEHSRHGQRNALQHNGSGKDELTLSGSIFPGKWGDADSLEELAAMADSGQQHRLLNEWGFIEGMWMIDRISDQQSHLDTRGRPYRIDFNILLKRGGS